MARRKLTPISFGGVGIVTTGRLASIEYDEGGLDTPRHDVVPLQRIGRFPSLIRTQPNPKTFPLRIRIASPDSAGQFDEIARIFNPSLGLQLLVVEDCDQQKQVLCVPQQVVHDDDHYATLTVPLWAPDPILEDVAQTTDVDTITGAGAITLDLRNIGSYDALGEFIGRATVQKTAAQGYIYVSEVAYANRSEYSLTGPGNGKWMLQVAPIPFDTAAEVSAGRMLATGDDIAVFVDEVQVPPEKVSINNINTTVTEVWIEIADAPTHGRDLIIAIAAGTTTFTFADVDHGFEAGDYLTWINDAAATEQARVTSVVDNTIIVTRNERNTTAGASAIGVTIYRSGHHIQLAWGWSGAPTRPTNPDPPLIDLDLSTNLLWNWTTSPVWPDNNRRSGGWRRILYSGRDDVPELRKNRLSAKTALDASGLDIRFTDIDPTAARPNFDALEFQACCGIDDIAGAVEYDATLDWPFNFQIIGRDLLGLDEVIFNRVGHETPPAHFPPRIYTNQQETPSSILSAVIFRCRNMVVTTARPDDSTAEGLGLALATGADVQKIQIDEETQLIGIVVRVRDPGASGSAIETQVNEVAFVAGEAPGELLVGPLGAAGVPGVAYAPVCFISAGGAFTTDIPTLAPGEYFVALHQTGGSPGDIEMPVSSGSIYAKGEVWEYDSTLDQPWVRLPSQDMWFAILGYNVDNQEETLMINRSGEDLLINDVTLVFDPDRTPIVTPAAREDAYYYDSTLARGDDSMRFRFLKRSADALGNDVTIDIDARTVIDDENGDSIRQTLVPVGDPWLSLVPGANAVTVTPDLGSDGEQWTGQFRSAWQA